MSDIKDPPIALQRRMQQRQILAMMGIHQWVQPNSETINIADISAPTITHNATQSIAANTSIGQPSNEQPSADTLNIESSDTKIANIESVDAMSGIVENESTHASYHDADDAGVHQPNAQSPVTYSFDTSTPDVSVATLVDAAVQQTSVSVEQDYPTESHYDNNLKIAPFDLQGGRYGDWVVFVDIQALNNDSQKLWQNIMQALSISCETTSFPICEGMDTAELANASLAGYVFKIGRSEEIKVAALTELPDGLAHPNFTTVPTLDEMFADSGLKRQLWEQLSE